MNSASPSPYPSALAEILSRTPELEPLVRTLENEGLAGVWGKYLREANPACLAVFLSEVRKLDWEHIRRHRRELQNFSREAQASHVVYLPVKADPDQAEQARTDTEEGWASLRRGEWAVTIFAGGAGTRFFSEWPRVHEALPVPSERMRVTPPKGEDPKGLFPISPVMGWSFLQCIMAEALETGIGCGRLPLLYLMTSRVTHAPIKRWLDTDPLWGFPPQGSGLFMQPEIPRLDEEGDLLVNADGSLFWTGNGHGGIYGALLAPGETGRSVHETLRAAGISRIVMGNVDNTAAHPLLPARLGYHIRTQARMTLTVVPRTDPAERVGMTARRADTGRVEVIEYSVLDPELSASVDEKGNLLFNNAHINTNLLDLDAVSADLPGTLYTGKPVSIGQKLVNSSTYEFLNQHLASLLDPGAVRVYEGPREALFMPTKAVLGRDSVESTVAELRRQAAAGLCRLGASVAGTAECPSAHVEWHPCLGLDDAQRAARGVGKDWVLSAESRLYLGVRHGLGGAAPYGAGLRLEEGAALILDAQRPYGVIAYDPLTRAISEDAATAGRLRIGSGVTLRPGVRVAVTIEGDGCVTIPDGTIFAHHLECRVKPGQSIQLGDTGP